MEENRRERAERMLDHIFTPAWRNQRSEGPPPSQATQDFSRLCTEHCYADSWAREGRLDLKTRSLVTIATIVSLGSTEELKLHIRGALNLGHEPDDIVELFIHLLPYLGTPRLTHAMSCAREVFDQTAASSEKQ